MVQIPRLDFVSAFQAELFLVMVATEGVALGYGVSAFQAEFVPTIVTLTLPAFWTRKQLF
jgi:hypothetical protein